MNKSKSWKKLIAAGLSVMCGLSALGGVATLPSMADGAEPLMLVYNQEDLSAEFGGTYKDDTGKSGVRIRSQKSGVDAEGSSFSFENDFQGNFEMDFRVTSKTPFTYKEGSTGGYTHTLSANPNSAITNDNMNPFLDLKEVGIRFQSNSDLEKYFIVYIRGTCTAGTENYNAANTSATVFVSGDVAGLPSPERGYGIPVGATSYISQWYKNSTNIGGTSFSNYTATSSSDRTEAPTTSNLVKFDAENMKVYVNATNVGNPNSDYRNRFADINTSANVLVRDLSSNDYVTDEYTSARLSTLSKEDFANGYTVSVEFSDVTANDCVGDVAFCDAVSNPGQYATISSAYDRYADMTVYAVNGTSFTQENVALDGYIIPKVERSQMDFITYNADEFIVTEDKSNAVFSGRGLNIRSVASGDAVENAGFDFKNCMLGDFDMTFGVTSKVSYQHSNLTNAATHYTTDTSDDLAIDAYNPYADLKEVAITFTSKSNPEKFFTMYIRSGRETRAYITTARVYVNGDKNADGFGLYDMTIDGNWTTNVSKGKNSFTPLFGTSFSNIGYSKETAVAALPNKIRFDTENMKVYATSYNDGTQAESERLVRDLTDSSMITWYDDDPDFYKTLSKEDFAQGYTVSVAFTEMTANDCVGSASELSQFGWAKNDGTEGGYVTFDEAYDRYADMTIYSLNGQQFEYVDTNKLRDESTPLIGGAMQSIALLGKACDVTPLYYDATSGNKIDVYGTVSLSTDGENYTTIEKNADGKYLYTPNAYGTLWLTYEGFGDASGHTAQKVVAKISVYDDILPQLALAEGLINRYDFTNGKDAKPKRISASDIVILNRQDEVKTYDVSIESVTLPNGTAVKVTALNYLDAGDYVVSYLVKDSFGNESRLVRTIEVGDFSAPVISVAEKFECNQGDTVDLTAAITDYSKVKPTQIVVVKDGQQVSKGAEFFADKAGEYTVCYTAIDEFGNEAKREVSLTVYGQNDLPITLSIIFFSIAGIGLVTGAVFTALLVKRKKEEK